MWTHQVPKLSVVHDTDASICEGVKDSDKHFIEISIVVLRISMIRKWSSVWVQNPKNLNSFANRTGNYFIRIVKTF